METQFRFRNQALISGVSFGTRDRQTGEVDWTAPNNGRYSVGHIDTFLNRFSSMASVYRDADEALLNDRDNAKSMLNDLSIRECLDSRQRSVALLNWHIEPEDEKFESQRQFCALLEAICSRITHFYKYRLSCQEAIWYGKYGIQHRWGCQIINNRSVWIPTPRHQDYRGCGTRLSNAPFNLESICDDRPGDTDCSFAGAFLWLPPIEIVRVL